MPLLWLSLAFLAGILLAASLHLPAGVWLLLSGIVLLIGLSSRFLRTRNITFISHASRIAHYASRFTHHVSSFTSSLPPLPYSLIPFFLFLGAARYQFAQPDLGSPEFIAAYNDRGGEVSVQGVLVEPPDRRDTYANLKLRVEEIIPAGETTPQEVSGLLLAKDWNLNHWHYGDRLLLQGWPETPPESEDFSYRDYLAGQGVYSLMDAARVSLVLSGQGNPLLEAVYAYKERALDAVYRLWPDPEASLLAGILLGVESGIPEKVKQAFQDTGTAHIIAISGFNITIIAGLFYAVFSRLLGRYKGAALAVLGILLYTLLVGASPSVLRAALMGGLSLFASQLGRRQFGLLSLALVAAVMAAFNPRLLWDPGFQLSFFATLGLILYAEPFSRAFVAFAERRLPAPSVERLTRPVTQYLLFTLAASITTLPIIAYHFHQLSLVSLIANLAILPVQPAVMILGGLALLLGTAYFSLGQLAAWLAWPGAVYTIRAVEWFAGLRGATLDLGVISAPVVLVLYAALFALTLAGARVKQAAAWLKPGLALAVFGLITVLIWREALAATDGRLHLTLLDTNTNLLSGEAILIQTPSGRELLVNGGPSATRLSEALGRRLPLSNRRLDFLLVANPVEGQVAALPRIVERFPPANVLWAGQPDASPQARSLQLALVDAHIPITPAETGQVLQLGQGAELRLLAAGERGALFLLAWGNFRALLPVGVNFDQLEALGYGKQIGPVTALLLADQGYAPANPPQWIANLRPQVVLLSVAAGNREGLPSPETLQALQGYTLLRTDRNGWIELTTDGEQMWMEVEGR